MAIIQSEIKVIPNECKSSGKSLLGQSNSFIVGTSIKLCFDLKKIFFFNFRFSILNLIISL